MSKFKTFMVAFCFVALCSGSWANDNEVDDAFPVVAPEIATRDVSPSTQEAEDDSLGTENASVETVSPEGASDVEEVSEDSQGIVEELSPRESKIQAALRDQKIKMALEKAQREMFYGRNIQAEHKEVEEVFKTRERAQKPPIVIHGDLRSEFARHTYGGDRFSKIKNQLTLNGTGKLSNDLHFRMSGRVYYDSVYDLDYYPRDVQKDQKYDVELRETYVDYSQGPFDLRVGKQQIVWGESAWAFVADVVNGKDYREFILADFDRIRIPEWGTDLEYTHNDFHSEFIFIPVPEMDRLPKAGAEFYGPVPLPPLTLATTHDAKEPGYGFNNSKLGVRFAYLFNSLDLGAFYLHGWNGSPVNYRTINAGVYEFDPQYKRVDTYGATFSQESNGTVYKGEVAFSQDGYFTVLDSTDSDGVVKSSYVDYSLGANRTIFEKINVDAQFIQRVIMDYDKTFFGVESKASSIAAVSVQRDFINHKLDAELRVMVGLEKYNALYRAGFKYNLTDNLQAKTGAELFSGEADTSFGFYRPKSRYYGGLTWKF